MSMDIYSKSGSHVRFQYPNNGYVPDKETAEQFLEIGEVYTVEVVEVDSWQTHVWLKEIPGVAFNSVMFENV